MKKNSKYIGLAVSMLICAIFVIIFANSLTKSSLPDDYCEYECEQIGDNLKVYRNQYGVPHIIGKNELDVYFALGFCQAQDRMWQMELSRRTGKGELSEIFGVETVDFDKFIRTVEIKKISERIWANYDRASKNLLEAYSNGVNYYLEVNKNNLPFEFSALNFTPQKWSPVDCIVISRLFAFEMSHSFWADITIGKIAERIGVQKTKDLIPGYSESYPCVFDEISSRSYINSMKKDTAKSADSTKIADTSVVKRPLKPQTKISELQDSYQIMKYIDNRFNYILPQQLGSNSWAVKKMKSSQTSTIIACDPHNVMSLPSLWYQVHLSCPSYNSVGLSLAGSPAILIGRNDYIAWGIASAMVDDCDFFIEKIDSANSNFYILPNGSKQKFKFTPDTILVKNSNNVVYYLKSTQRSCVVSDAYIPYYPSDLLSSANIKNNDDIFNKRYCLTFNWTGTFKTNELKAANSILHCKNWQQFSVAVQSFSVPAVNFVFSDRTGNLGVIFVGAVPNRENECISYLPNPSWKPNCGWLNQKDSINIPRLFNPKKNYVFAANNKLFRNAKNNYSYLWELHSRALRIDELLDNSEEFSVFDSQVMQKDVFSYYAKSILQSTRFILDLNQRQMNTLETAAWEMLKNWDYTLLRNKPEATVYEYFVDKLVYNTFSDELGDELYQYYYRLKSLPQRKLLEMLQDTSGSAFFDNVNTKEKETNINIIFISFRQAIESIKEKYGDNIEDWQYDEIHQLTLKHAFTNNKHLRKSVNLGPYVIDGDNSTINLSAWKGNDYDDVISGASARFVADMEDTLVFSILAGGISGEPYSSHYQDQLSLWRIGSYVKIPINRTPGNDFSLVIEFIPKKNKK